LRKLDNIYEFLAKMFQIFLKCFSYTLVLFSPKKETSFLKNLNIVVALKYYLENSVVVNPHWIVSCACTIPTDMHDFTVTWGHYLLISILINKEKSFGLV
jgi:hypothetical protein